MFIGACNFYRIDPRTGGVDLVSGEVLFFSPGEKIVYVADSGASRELEPWALEM